MKLVLIHTLYETLSPSKQNFMFPLLTLKLLNIMPFMVQTGNQGI